jgi:molybdate transport system substrate-binding protein
MLAGRLLLLLALTLWSVWGGATLAKAEPPVIVFAAASLKEALDEVATQFTEMSGTEVSVSYGGSSALARQIQYGAPAQIFLSANAAWMDVVQQEGLLVPESRLDLLGNRLVLIAGIDLDVSLDVSPDMDLSNALNGGRLAMALVDAVPAGIYGRAALRSLGVWEQVQGQTAQTDNVRAALRLVSVGAAPLGIVYATDAAADPRVRSLGVFPDYSHPPILYPVARLARDDTASVRAFYDYLTGASARTVFDRYGFVTPLKEGP